MVVGLDGKRTSFDNVSTRATLGERSMISWSRVAWAVRDIRRHIAETEGLLLQGEVQGLMNAREEQTLRVSPQRLREAAQRLDP